MADSSVQDIVAILGQPVAANPTQYMMEKALAQAELDWRFFTLEVSPDGLGDAVRGLRAMGFRGASIAAPHQAPAVELLDELTDAARFSQMVNFVRRDERKLVGGWTEPQAVVECIREFEDLQAKRALVLGCGSRGRAIAAELSLAGATVTLAEQEPNPSDRTADFLRQVSAVTYHPLGGEAGSAVLETADVLVGDSAAESVDHSQVQLAALPKSAIVVDLTFDPSDARLLQQARERANRTIDGLQLFVSQAAINFQLWTGVRPDMQVMREAMEEFLEI